MGDVVKFRVRLTPYDIDMATSWGKPLREYAERLAEVSIETRRMFRRQNQRPSIARKALGEKDGLRAL
jgi:hypothetical protein